MSMAAAKRFRPPNLTLASDPKPAAAIQLESESPVELSDDDDILHLDSSGSSPTTSPAVPALSMESSDDDPVSDDISKDLAVLAQLRKSVQKNLRLRPIRSHNALPKVNLGKDPSTSPFSPPSSAWRESAPRTATSPTSSTASCYFTPLSDTHPSPLSARYIGSSAPNSSSQSRAPSPRPPRPIDAGTLYDRLSSLKRPLLIDTRPPALHLAFHIQHSINVAIPSLILKRCRKPGGGFPDLDSLRQFITTEQGKEAWDGLIGPGGPWDGDVVVYGEEMDPKDKDNLQVAPWALLPVIAPLLTYGGVDYLAGGISAVRHHPDLRNFIFSGGEFDFGTDDPPPIQGAKKGGGLFQLDTQTAVRSTTLPEIDLTSSSTASSAQRSPSSPLPVMPSAIPPSSHNVNPNIADSTPSPPPSQVGFRRPAPPTRHPSVPNLRRLDTSSTERLNGTLPKLQVRTKPIKSASLSVPPLHTSSLHPTSPSHLNLVYSNYSPPGSARWSATSPSEFLTPYFTPPHTPGTPKPPLPPSPSTARPETDQPPTTEEPFPVFTVSTILPNFLYLGPELTAPEHVSELQELGVRRILNIAAECDDDHGLHLKDVFERYVKIPMRDTVEEENIAKGVREVCEIIDDARLHSAPTYVHCKAGKSRSVTAVIAYLIHANHWTLSRAYSFVLERRKGISPNIGFVSELMTFEEEELGGKSVGVQPSAPTGSVSSEGDANHHLDPGHGHGHGNYGGASGNRRGGHVRESLPPVFVSQVEGLGPLSAGGLEMRVMGDSGQEMEIKDSSGRYRHARRAPVDETTLQPLRRVSKAGLESSVPVYA